MKNKIILISCTLVALIFISTGIIFSLNSLDLNFTFNLPIDKEVLSFDATLYFMIVTVCTIGYGDIYPNSSFSRIVISFFIILIIVVISK